MHNEDNLKPVRTTEEARERGRNGGIKSGEVRRKKRDAKSAARMILNLPVTDTTEQQLKRLGIEPDDFTNLVAVMARALTKAMTGDVGAMGFLVEMAAISPRAKMEAERHKKAMEDGKPTDNLVDDWVASIPEFSTDGDTG